jgi:hypothetical protein
MIPTSKRKPGKPERQSRVRHRAWTQKEHAKAQQKKKIGTAPTLQILVHLT